MIFTLNFYEFLHTNYKCVLNSVVKISIMFTQYFEYYAIIFRGRFVDTLSTGTVHTSAKARLTSISISVSSSDESV